MNLKSLKNNYFILRHGKSSANEEGIIISDPKNGILSYGLVEEGRQQVKASAKKAKEEKVLDKKTIIVSSDFSRALETAEITREVLGCGQVIVSTKLRERNFGDWEKTHNSNYQRVWDDDIKDANHKVNNDESAQEVLDRTSSLINDLEEEYTGKNILLISHGDALQILQTAFEKVSPSHHRTLRHLETAEIRRLHLKE